MLLGYYPFSFAAHPSHSINMILRKQLIISSWCANKTEAKHLIFMQYRYKVCVRSEVTTNSVTNNIWFSWSYDSGNGIYSTGELMINKCNSYEGSIRNNFRAIRLTLSSSTWSSSSKSFDWATLRWLKYSPSVTLLLVLPASICVFYKNFVGNYFLFLEKM